MSAPPTDNWWNKRLNRQRWEEAKQQGAVEERARILKQVREFQENLALHGYYAPATRDRDRFAYNRVGELITQIEGAAP